MYNPKTLLNRPAIIRHPSSSNNECQNLSILIVKYCKNKIFSIIKKLINKLTGFEFKIMVDPRNNV